MPPATLAIIYGIASAIVWGAGDFSGGVAAKRNNVFHVVLGAHIVGFFVLVGLALVFSEGAPSTRDMLFGSLAGIGGMVGVLAFYSGLAKGRMGVVAPIAAVVTAIIPIIVGFVQDGFPPAIQLVGFAIALVAVWFLAASGGFQDVQWQEVTLPAIAGLGFALFLVFADQLSDGHVFWPLAVARTTSIIIVGILLLVRPPTQARPAMNQLPIIALAGIFDTGGNAFFALAAQAGRLDLASVLSSLYPASTVLLAWLILGETLTKLQKAGVVLALLALILIAI